MDIVTHATMGAILAKPFLTEYPLSAAAFVLGSTLPDLDALSRLFGKRAFLTWHQTYSHSLPLIALGCGAAWLCACSLGSGDYQVVLALGMGMTVHVLLDLTNTYGVKLLFPFSRRRFSLEWVFFIDALVITVNLLAILLLWTELLPVPGTPVETALGYLLFLVSYGLLRFLLRCRARTFAPAGTLSLMPSALWPWVYFACQRSAHSVQVIRINALTGTQRELATCAIHDDRYADVLDRVPELRVMRELTPAYHLVEVVPRGDQVLLSYRDLRTTNFNTRFGQLDLLLEADGRIVQKCFHV